MTYDEALTFVWRLCKAHKEATKEYEKNGSPQARRDYYALTNMKADAIDLTSMAFDKTKSDVMRDVQFRKAWR